jgi:UDP-N-acetylglucosamine 4,6-dehydratase
MISEDEARNTKIYNGIYVILPQFFESKDAHNKYKKYSYVPEGFSYRSDKNDIWLTVDELKDMIKSIE